MNAAVLIRGFTIMESLLFSDFKDSNFLTYQWLPMQLLFLEYTAAYAVDNAFP